MRGLGSEGCFRVEGVRPLGCRVLTAKAYVPPPAGGGLGLAGLPLRMFWVEGSRPGWTNNH